MRSLTLLIGHRSGPMRCRPEHVHNHHFGWCGPSQARWPGQREGGTRTPRGVRAPPVPRVGASRCRVVRTSGTSLHPARSRGADLPLVRPHARVAGARGEDRRLAAGDGHGGRRAAAGGAACLRGRARGPLPELMPSLPALALIFLALRCWSACRPQRAEPRGTTRSARLAPGRRSSPRTAVRACRGGTRGRSRARPARAAQPGRAQPGTAQPPGAARIRSRARVATGAGGGSAAWPFGDLPVRPGRSRAPRRTCRR